MSNLEIQLAKAEAKIENFLNNIDKLEKRIDDFDTMLEKKFITKTEFQPVKLLVYGFAGIIFTGFVGALLMLVFIK